MVLAHIILNTLALLGLLGAITLSSSHLFLFPRPAGDNEVASNSTGFGSTELGSNPSASCVTLSKLLNPSGLFEANSIYLAGLLRAGGEAMKKGASGTAQGHSWALMLSCELFPASPNKRNSSGDFD